MNKTIVGAILIAGLAIVSPPTQAGEVTLEDPQGNWELSYGFVYYRVVGNVKNTSAGPVPYARVELELVDASGKSVFAQSTYNASAEVLNDLSAGELLAKVPTVTPIAPGASDLFRIGIGKDEIPAFATYRVRLVSPNETPWIQGPAPLAPGTTAPLVDVNSAGEKELATLPEMTPARVKAVLNYREGNGTILHIEELALIPQIAPIFDAIRPHLVLE